MSKNESYIKKIRKEFLFLEQKKETYPYIYFDSAATAQMPISVLERMVHYYRYDKTNIGRGIYQKAEKVTESYEEVRTKIATFIGAQSKEIAFTSGTTAGINLIAQVWAHQHIHENDEIVVSNVEHHSNFVPWQQLALQKKARLIIVPVNEQGVITPEILQNYLSSKTKLVALFHQSNILGSINDIASLAPIVHAVGAKFLVDAAQSVVHIPLDVQKLQCDFLLFSSHKLYGPTGAGVIYIRHTLLPEITISSFGGGMVFSVTSLCTIFKNPPYAFEAGTQPIAELLGLGASIDFIQSLDRKLIHEHEMILTQYLICGLRSIPSLQIISATTESTLVTFYSDVMHAHDIAAYLDQYNIAVRAGHHCVQPYLESLALTATVRVSFGIYNTIEEVDVLLQCLMVLFKKL